MPKIYDIELYDTGAKRHYVYIISLPTGTLDTIFTRLDGEDVLSIEHPANVPDKIQLAFYKERTRVLKDATP